MRASVPLKVGAEMSVAGTDPNLRLPAGGTRPVDVGLLCVRFALGAVFIAHGAQKVLGAFGGPGLAATVTGMGRMGIPAPLAYLAAYTEFVGGILLVIGLLSRLAALAIFVEMIVAVLTVHLRNGFFMNWGQVAGKGEGYEYHILVFGMTLLIMLAGPGRLALGDIEGWILRRRRR